MRRSAIAVALLLAMLAMPCGAAAAPAASLATGGAAQAGGGDAFAQELAAMYDEIETV
jgi:hypothetical protein